MNERKSIFRRLFEKRNDDSNLLNPKTWLLNALGMTKSLTGVSVNEVTAMNLSAVYACVRIISETIASLPLNVYRRLDKGKEKATDHPLYRALHTRPNKDMTSFSWRELMGVQLNTNGNSYNVKQRTSTGSVVGFYPLLASRMNVEIKDDEVVYKYTFNDNIERIIPKRDMLHIPGLSFNGIIGKSPITMAREAIGLGLALEEFGSRFFSNGTNVGGVAQHPGKLTAQGRENLSKSINETYQGLGNAYKLMLLEEGMTYQKISIPPNDAQFIESRRFQLEEIARMFRVPKHLLQDLMNASFSNIEHQSIDFVVHTIRPWLVRIEQALNADPELFDDEYFCEFVVDGLLRGDVATRFQSYTQAIQNGIYSPNDVLEMENKNSYDGGERHFIQLNMQSVEDIGKEPPAPVQSNSVTLADKLTKAYKPLLYNALIRIQKREETDINKICKGDFTTDDVETYYKKHSEFVSTQIKPVVYAFTQALGAECNAKESDITIFADSYSKDFVERYVEGNLTAIKDKVTVATPEYLSDEEMPRIRLAFSRYVKNIG
jgi:HK97 family phage portal protein